MNDAALNQLPANMHDLEEEGNANGFVCLSVCLSDKVVFIASLYSKIASNSPDDPLNLQDRREIHYGHGQFVNPSCCCHS